MAGDAMTLNGKVAFVTGAARGIGQALALGLAGQGCVVVAADVDAPGAQGTVRRVIGAGGSGHAFELDVSNADQVQAGLAFALSLGGLDILINNAGVFPRSPVLDLAQEEWDRVLAVNLKGTFLCAQAAARHMVAAGRGGRIVNVTSGAAFMATPNSAHYSASKAGIVALTRVLALELAAHRITVNAIAPGLTDTAQPRIAYSEEDLQAFARRTPVGRIAQPEDMLPTVLFLCSEAAGYITGQTLHINGGLYMP